MSYIETKDGRVYLEKNKSRKLEEELDIFNEEGTQLSLVQLCALSKKLDKLRKAIPPEKFANLYDWTIFARPTVDGIPNRLAYFTFWHDIYRDNHPWIMLMIARQMGKSTYFSNRAGYTMTKKWGSSCLYLTYEDESRSVFSKKFRSMWRESDILRQFVKGPTFGAVKSVELNTNSVTWLVTHANKFTHVEGKSTDDQVWDEGPYLDLDFHVKAKEAQSFSHGTFALGGIGGWVDTIYDKWWQTTDRREWKYDDRSHYEDSAGKPWPGQGWRSKLKFDNDGLVWDDYLIDALKGKWVITQQANSLRHGYHLSQYSAPWIPLSKADAVKLYKLLPEDSIEGKLETYPQADFQRHVKAENVAGAKKPFPREALYTLCDKNRKFLKPSEVNYDLGKLYLGVDWGGGGRTVKWIYQVINDDIPIFVLVNAQRVETQNVEQQLAEVIQWMDDYEIRQAVVDGGGGSYQVQKLEERYGDRCRKFFYLTRPAEPTAKDSDEKRKWNRSNQWQYDKTWLMQRVEDYIKRQHIQGTQTINRIVWPGQDMEQVEWIIDQFANELTEKAKISGGGYYTRYYTDDRDRRPDDALHAQNLAIVAWDLGRQKSTGHAVGTVGGTRYSFFLDSPRSDYGL